jgi:hypothetical protein
MSELIWGKSGGYSAKTKPKEFEDRNPKYEAARGFK